MNGRISISRLWQGQILGSNHHPGGNKMGHRKALDAFRRGKECQECGNTYRASRQAQRFCSKNCRKAYWGKVYSNAIKEYKEKQ
jgi:protein-arginine kinase activator protein McsA